MWPFAVLLVLTFQFPVEIFHWFGFIISFWLNCFLWDYHKVYKVWIILGYFISKCMFDAENDEDRPWKWVCECSVGKNVVWHLMWCSVWWMCFWCETIWFSLTAFFYFALIQSLNRTHFSLTLCYASAHILSVRGVFIPPKLFAIKRRVWYASCAAKMN